MFVIMLILLIRVCCHVCHLVTTVDPRSTKTVLFSCLSLTVSNSAMDYGVTLWKFVDDNEPENITSSLSFMPKVERVATISHQSNTTVVKSIWSPIADQLFTYDDNMFALWDIGDGVPKVGLLVHFYQRTFAFCLV